jgi:putative serine protease PepD
VKGPRHLWTGDWRSASHENDEALAEHERLQPPSEDPLAEPAAAPGAAADSEPQRRSRWRSAPLAIGLLIAVIAAGALFVSSLVGGGSTDTGSSQSAQSPNALPSVGPKPLTPRKGQTVAGAVYNAASPAVVSIRTSQGSGTGFLIDNKGTIVTNDHVVGTSKRVIARFGRDGGQIDADVLGTDPSSDLAVITIPKSAIPKGAKPLQFADSRNVSVGDTVIAIGNPFDLDRTATEGIVSALGRDITSPNNYTINNVIQTDAPINPGNSGGPLLDVSAHVIGVNSQIATSGTSNGNLGIGFAVPANTVRQVVPILEKGGTVKRAYLGVESGSPNPGTGGGTGAQVSSLVPGGPAQRAGLQIGDVIKSVAGQKVADPTQLSTVVSNKQPGDTVSIVVVRGGSKRTIQVTLGTRPASTSSP